MKDLRDLQDLTKQKGHVSINRKIDCSVECGHDEPEVVVPGEGQHLCPITRGVNRKWARPRLLPRRPLCVCTPTVAVSAQDL